MIKKYLTKSGLIPNRKKDEVKQICSYLTRTTVCFEEKNRKDILFDLLSDEMSTILGLNGQLESLEDLIDNFKQLMFYIIKNKSMFRNGCITERVAALKSAYPPLLEVIS